MSNIVSFTDVSKVYPTVDKPAVNGISFEVEEGDFFCIIGPSGCGKSTILNMLTGLEEPSSGRISRPDHISMVFQSGALFPWLTVSQNVAVGIRAREKQISNPSVQIEHYVSMVRLSEFKDKYPRELSGGQRQRVGIARALAADPDVLVFDEAFSQLDIVTTEEIHKDLLDIWGKTGKTIVMVSHSIEEAVVLANNIMLMREGQFDQLFHISLDRPRREQAHQFIEYVQKIRIKFLRDNT